MAIIPATALNRARAKAYIRLLPLLCISYAIAYVDRVNVSLATIEMSKDLGCDLRLMSSVNDVSGIPTEGKSLIIVAAVDHVLHFRIFDGDGKMVVDTDEKRLTEQARQIEDLRKQLESLWPPHELTGSEKDRVITAVTSIVGHSQDLLAFDNAVIGFGAGVFFIGYFLLEIPGTLLVEKWSARKWICRIMVSWGIVAALTAFVKTPWQFYARAVLARPGRGRVLPRRDRLPDALVPRRDRAQGPVLVLHRHAGRAVRQPEALELLAADRHDGDDRRRDGPAPRAPGDAGLAVDVHRLGHPGGDPGDPGLVLLPDWPRDARWLEPTSARPWSRS